MNNALMFLDIETTSLNPASGRITCIGFSNHFSVPGPERTIETQFIYDDNEKALLLRFLSFIEPLFDTNLTIITYNGKKFDIPYLEHRFQACEIRFPKEFFDASHLDLYEVRKKELADADMKYKSASMSETCYAYGLYIPKNTSSEYMAKLIGSRFSKNTPPTDLEINDILFHNKIDIFALSALYYRMKEFGVVYE